MVLWLKHTIAENHQQCLTPGL